MTVERRYRELEHILTDAALQALFMRARKNDREDEASGIRFLYGVDANVVRSWGDNFGESGRLSRVGRIFRSDGDLLANAISSALLNFIFSRLGPDRIPMMVIPPIERELLAILEALQESEDASRQSHLSPESVKRLAKLTGALSGSLSSSELAELNLKLQDLLFEDASPTRTLRRINLLFTRAEVAPLGELEMRLPPELRHVFFPSNPLAQWFEIGTALSGSRDGAPGSRGWKERLRKSGSWASSTLMDHDAEVLAKIEVWNRALCAQGLPWRLLYLTADFRLFRAAAEYRPSQSNRDFAELYLRHPHAYLSEEGVLGVVGDTDGGEQTGIGAESVGEWLTLLTEPANASLEHLLASNRTSLEVPSAIRDFALSKAEIGKSWVSRKSLMVDEIDEKWDSFAKRALVTEPFGGNLLDGLSKDLTRPAQEFVDVVNDVHKQLQKDRRQALTEYLQVTTRLGRNFEANVSDRRAIRPVAPVYFEEWRKAGEAIALMSRWAYDDVDIAAYQRAVDLLESDDSTAYAFYLGHATFFAARGRLPSAALVSRQARRIGQTFRSNLGFDLKAAGAHGREAAFFEATCRRQLAEGSEQLDLARACLEEAAEVLAVESQSSPEQEFVGERIAIEAATIDLYDYVFAQRAGSFSTDRTERFANVADRLWREAEQIGLRLQGLKGIDHLELGGAQETRVRVETQLLTLLINVSFMPDARSIDHVRATEAFSRLNTRLEDTDSVNAGLSEIERISLLAAQVRDSNRRNHGNLRRRFQRAVDHINRSSELQTHDIILLELLEQGTRPN